MSQTQIDEQEFYNQIRLLWSSESMLLSALPGMIKKARDFGLVKSLALHLAETDQHKVALELIAKQLDFKIEGADNTEMKQIIEEGKKLIEDVQPGASMDALIIQSALKVENYEMREYEKAGKAALKMSRGAIAKRLFLTRTEEIQAATKLEFHAKNLLANKPEPSLMVKME